MLQALYQMQLADCSAAEAERQFRQDYDMKRVDTEYFHDVLSGIERERVDIMSALDPLLGRESKALDPVERAVLLIGAFELLYRIDIPYRVVINESVELARQFGAAESHRFVNSALDALAKQCRVVERSGSRNG
ncbi:MAG: transcription antitermination factor NusB [Pseudomonadales bacterium]|nr:transcription antitermination factor NusB [Pseudomonadales bacterium]